jgi:uncharacterized protein DUF5677
MGSEYISLFDNKDGRGFSITVEDLSITTVQQEVKDMLDLAEPSVFRISDKIELIPMPGYDLRELVLRCIVRKAYESMLAILDLVRLRHSLPAMSLLRSMCEELIFAKFIKLLPYDDVETFLSEKSMLELFQGQNAQIEYFSYISGKTTNNELFEKQKKLRKKLIEVPRQRLKELEGKLGWGRNASPTVKYMAAKTGSLEIYNFFYHAASSSVHASLHNLLRMVWGNPETGQFSITNMNYERYYRKVVIAYGATLFSEIMEAVRDSFPDMWEGVDHETYQEKVAFIINFTPPIVTKEELNWRRASNK